MITHQNVFYLIQFLFLEFVFHVFREQLQSHDFVQQDFYVVDKASRAKETNKKKR